ncbi:unnamed protein product, partial [marine sediment metagenome]
LIVEFEEHILVETEHIATNKKEQILHIAHGIITWVSVFFPPGCHNMVHCVVLHHEHQIFPSTEGMTLAGNATPIEWTEYYESYQPPYELKVKLWGVGCAYKHTITVRVAILPRKAIIAIAIVDAIKGMFGLLRPKRLFTLGQGRAE